MGQARPQVQARPLGQARPQGQAQPLREVLDKSAGFFLGSSF